MQLQTINDRPVLRLLCDKPAREELEGLVQRLRGELSARAPSLAVCNVSPDARADENYLAAAYVVVYHSASVQVPQYRLINGRQNGAIHGGSHYRIN